jgi:hypothetical protein
VARRTDIWQAGRSYYPVPSTSMPSGVEMPEQSGRCQKITLLGEGGMGEVWDARGGDLTKAFCQIRGYQ